MLYVSDKKAISMERRVLSRRVLWLYLLTFGLMLSGALVGIWQSWLSQVQETQSRVVYTANMASSVIETNLADALKLLEIPRQSLLIQDASQLDPLKIHSILDSTAREFGQSREEDAFGLLLFVNRKGQLLAQSGGFPSQVLDVSDRRYFKELIANPSLSYAVGDLVEARTTGVFVFHIAIPVRNKAGEILGILAQQINVSNLVHILELGGAEKIDQVISFLPEGNVLFVYPVTGFQAKVSQQQEVFSDITTRAAGEGVFWSQTYSDGYKGYVRSSRFGISTVAMTSVGSMLGDMAKAQANFLLYLMAVLILIGYLYRTLYRKSLEAKVMEGRSLHDPLTGLRNRTTLNEFWPKLLRDALRNSSSVSVLFIDIDHFKRLNDQYGHDAGDQALMALARKIQRCVKRPYDFICRWGGEEFVAVLPGSDEAGARHVAERIMQSVRDMSLHTTDGLNLKMTVSIGVASLAVDAENINADLICHADAAMRQAKAAGRNQIVIYPEVI